MCLQHPLRGSAAEGSHSSVASRVMQAVVEGGAEWVVSSGRGVRLGGGERADHNRM